MPQLKPTVPAHLSPLRQDPHGDQTKLPGPACPYNHLRAVIGLQNLYLQGYQNHIFLNLGSDRSTTNIPSLVFT